MPTSALKVHLLALLLGCISVYIGSFLHNQFGNPMATLNGTWTGQATVVTNTGIINYGIDIWVQGEHFIFANTAQIGIDKKFAFRLDLEYVGHEQQQIVFAVKERQSVWLDELRQQGVTDIPLIGHLIQISFFKITENEVYMTSTLQSNYNFTALLQRGG